MKNKIFVLIFIAFFMFASTVFAANEGNAQLSKVDSDIYKDIDGKYSLDGTVYGNIFLSSKEFEMSNVATVEGNLYIICDTAFFKSNVAYSNSTSKDGSYSIETINSHSTVKGNVFIVCNKFILEPGSEINGDLYIIADKIDIQKSSIIHGNLFAIGSEILLNGKVGNSVYVASDSFTASYYGSINKDLHLSSKNVMLHSVIHRNAYIVSDSITTSEDFLLYGNLKADAHMFNFSGEIDGNANINSKEINFINNKDNQDIKCLISGNLDYSTEKEMQIENNIVNGKVNYSKYEEKLNKSTFSFKSFILDLITFVVYVLAVVLVFNLLNKNYKNVKNEITVKNVFSSLGVGILSLLAVITLSILLIVTQIGFTLSLVLIFAYLFLLFMAIPIFILDIASLFKNKYNLYLSTAVIALALYLISAIPVVGGIVMFVVLMTGIGRICNKVLLKN